MISSTEHATVSPLVALPTANDASWRMFGRNRRHDAANSGRQIFINDRSERFHKTCHESG
jgi:hypothetical protein